MSYTYELLPAQKEFLEVGDHDSDIDVALYQGGFGSGKTFSGSLLGIILALKYPGIRGLVGAQTYILVRDTTLVSYFEHLDKMGLQEGVDYNYLKAESKLVFSNKSEILFRHLEEPDKLKSLNLGFVELEEMSDIPRSTFDMLLGRLRQEKKPSGKAHACRGRTKAGKHRAKAGKHRTCQPSRRSRHGTCLQFLHGRPIPSGSSTGAEHPFSRRTASSRNLNVNQQPLNTA